MPVKKKTYTDAQKRAYARRMAQKRGTIKGKGFYKGFSKQVGSLFGGGVGSVYGAPLLGSAVGSYLGQKFADYTGFGAYHVYKNTIIAPQNVRIRNQGKHGDEIVVRHREYIGDIESSETFTKAYELDMNPGLATFPWLSGVANNFQVWQPNGIIFEYIPMSGTAVTGTSATLGSIIMATQHDSLEKEFEDKTEMLNHNFAVSVAPAAKAILPIECDPKFIQAPRLYVRDTEPPATADKRLSDLGRVTIATSDCPDTGSLLGSLFVTYEIKLMLPKLTHATGSLVKSARYQCSTGCDTNNNFGTARTQGHDSIGLTFNSNNQFTIPKNINAGKWCLFMFWQGASTVNVTAPTIATQTNMTGLQLLGGGSPAAYLRTNLSGGNADDQAYAYFLFDIDDSSKDAVFGLNTGFTLPTGITSMDLVLTQVDDDIA